MLYQQKCIAFRNIDKHIAHHMKTDNVCEYSNGYLILKGKQSTKLIKMKQRHFKHINRTLNFVFIAKLEKTNCNLKCLFYLIGNEIENF